MIQERVERVYLSASRQSQSLSVLNLNRIVVSPRGQRIRHRIPVPLIDFTSYQRLMGTTVSSIPMDDMSHPDRESSLASPGGTPGKHHIMRILWYINESTKWVVSALVFGILLVRRDETTAWCIIGGVVTAIVCRMLKFIINASRPSSSTRSDPGMPSSHASTLSFLSMFPSLMLMRPEGRHDLSSAVLLAWIIPLGGLFLTSLRVILGYHTVPQVSVGWFLGTMMAYAWVRFGVDLALPFLMSSMVGRLFLTATTCGFMALFAVKNVLRWIKED